MRTSELNQLIESPERLQKDQINDLQDLISEYPFFTSAQLLLTKAFYETENLNFEKQLRLTAAYAGDRKKLHDLLYVRTRTDDEDVIQSTDGQSADSQSTEFQKSETGVGNENAGLGHLSSEALAEEDQSPAIDHRQSEPDGNSLSAEQEEDNISEIGNQKSETIEQEKAFQSETDIIDEYGRTQPSDSDSSVEKPEAGSQKLDSSSLSTEQEEALQSDHGIIDEKVPISDPQSPISESEQSELDEQAKADQEFLDQQILSAAIGNSIVDELETGVQSPESRVQSPDPLKEDDGLGHLSSEALAKEDRSSAIESNAFDEAQPHSFSDWLKHYHGDSEPDADHRQSAIGNSKAEPKEILKSISKQVNEIQEKAEFYSAEKMARLSVTESEDLVTETLAKVFEDQGKFEKAIKAYEKLRLKFPEKRVYFAGRIKAVKKKLKS